MDKIRRLYNSKLYGIIDLGYIDDISIENISNICHQMIRGGIDLIQFRVKRDISKRIEDLAVELLRICRSKNVIFIINDFAKLAHKIQADGLHLGQDDITIDAARKIVGDNLILGKSTHSINQAKEASLDSKIDYIGFGPIFSTNTKPDYIPIGLNIIKEVTCLYNKLPVFCIGGININNLVKVKKYGANRVVIVSGILKSKNIETYVSKCKKIIE